MMSEISQPEPERPDGRMVPPPDPAIRALCKLIAREGEPKPRDGWVADIFW